jgi:hypothetical protein
MVNEKTVSNLSPGVDFNAGEKPADVRNQAREERYTPVPQGMSQTVKLAGMEAGVSEKDFTDIPRRRVMLKNGLQVSPDAPDKLHRVFPFLVSSTKATA